MDEKIKQDMEDIRRRIGPDYFALSRVPKKTREWFFEFAKEEFVDDRGMAFKHLCDVYRGIIDSGVEHLEMGLLDLDKRISLLEEKKEEKKVSRLAPPKEEKK